MFWSRVSYWLLFEFSSMSACSTGTLGDKTGFAARLIGMVSMEFRARRIELRPLLSAAERSVIE